MGRKTIHSLEEVLEFLHRDRPPYPACMLINELGIILEQGEDQDSAAENYLVDTLKSEIENHRAIAYCFLSSIQEVADRHSKELSEFRDNPENVELVVLIDKKLEEQKSEK